MSTPTDPVSALRPVVVAADGTSGSGKSSTCRGVASRLGLRYLDTGAQFRAVTWWMLDQGVDVHDPAAVAARCAEPQVESGTDPSAPTITVDGRDVSAEIRTGEVSDAVSPVATVPEVRARLLDLQREIIGAALAHGVGIVVEGRDIGSVVWPQAELKLFLTADVAARAARRTAEHEHLADVAATEANLKERDRIDSGRATAPLTRPDGAVEIDTTHHTLEQVIDLVADLVEEAAR